MSYLFTLGSFAITSSVQRGLPGFDDAAPVGYECQIRTIPNRCDELPICQRLAT